MAKKKITYYVFEPGISKDDNLLPNAVALLAANKSFLQEQVVKYINYNITNAIGPYAGYTYASSKCTRDVGYYIDSILHDLRYGGNVKTRRSSNYFWINGEPQIRGDVTPEITAQAYLRDIINDYIFTNTTVPTTYGTATIPQIKIIGAPAELDAAERASELWQIFIDVISTGTPAIPAKVNGVSSIRMIGNYQQSDFLLITDTSAGNILYNFSDPATSATIELLTSRSSGDGNPVGDLDFPSWWQTADAITTLYLTTDTSSIPLGTDIQIFVEEAYQTIRPWDFGTDAIERMRVSTPQAMLDADFEYGLQPTKWQAIGMLRNYPSLYELPGTDLSVISMTTDASANTGGFGSSLITVTTSGSHGFVPGSPITVKGLDGSVNGFSRGEGSFLVYSVPSSISFTYYASAKVGTVSGTSVLTSFIQIRQAGFYTGAAIGATTFSLFSNGTSQLVYSKFITPENSFQIAFDGISPTSGSPISGSPLIPAGTSVTGVIGASTINGNLKRSTTPTDTTIALNDFAGVQQGMAIDNGAGEALFINSVSGELAYLSGEFGQTLAGSDETYDAVSGTNIAALGSGATFNITRSAGVYTVFGNEDSSSNGQNYAAGDSILIAGTDLGGLSPDNDIFVSVNSVDSGGAILTFSSSGTASSGGATYAGVLASSQTGSGTGATIDVVRIGGTGEYQITLSDGGSSYADTDVLTWNGELFDGVSPDNTIEIRVDGVAFGTGAIVDFTIISTTQGATGNTTYVGVAGTDLPVDGAGATFSVESLDGEYIALVTLGSEGIDYRAGNRIVIAGTDLGGVSPLNDCTLTVTSVSGGAIALVDAAGTPFAGDAVNVYPAMTLSEALTGELPAETGLNVGAIATIQVDFQTNHGLTPGASILANVTSTPAPAFTSAPRTMPSSQTWTGVAFANGAFVAVNSGSSTSAYSLDGMSWQAGGVMPANTTWTSVAAGLIGATNYFVAIASGGTQAAYSTDAGLTWITATLPSSGTWSSVTYYNGYFIAVRSGSNAGAYSTNGTTWTASTLPSSSTWTDVHGGLIGSSTYIIAVASGGTAGAYSVDNGINWAASTMPASTTWSSVSFGNSRFVAVATGTSVGAISTNGTTWTAVTLPTSANWNNIAFGDDNFLIVANGSQSAITSFTGETGSWTDRTLFASQTWEETAYGNYAGVGIFAVVGNATNALSIVLTSANHSLAAGPFVITQVPTSTSIRYPARTTGTIDVTSPLTGVLYARPDSYFTHRPFDGGVQLGTGGPQHGAQAIRQSKKYIRYQSGKGIMYTTGALFAPNYNIASAMAVDYPAGSLITITTDDTDHGLQPGGIIELSGMNSFEYNGTYTVESITSSRSFKVRALVPLSTLNASLGSDAKISLMKWSGSTVKVGAFDDQNGVFYQFDGERLALVRRSSTFQLTGQIAITTESNQVQGTGTRFSQQLKTGDKVVIRGMTHTITKVSSDTLVSVTPDWRGVNAITGAKMCLIEELIVPQNEWNLDKGDGTGPSGYNILPNKMQMIGIQYSWYAAGFIEFMLRGDDGKFIFLHRIRNSNINTEAYMRTANLPVRYEVENSGQVGKLKTTMTTVDNTLELTNAWWFPTSGVLYIDNEIISYSGKSGNTLLGLSRAASHSSFAAGQNRSYTAGPAAVHQAGVGVELLSCTITPTISHWGSALLTDGRFDEDRGYLFNYAATGISASIDKQTAFMIRLAPSVSNALVGDLGERDLLNRAQLLLKEIAVTADSGSGALVIEGVLNPRNYPANASNITWNGLSSSGAGGQPSFAQIALGGSINWGGTPLTTATAAVSGAVTSSVSAVAFATDPYREALRIDRNFFIITTASYNTSGLQIGDTVTNATYLVGGRTITNIQPNAYSRASVSYTVITMSSNATANSPANTAVTVTTQLPGSASSYTGTNYLFFTNATWNSSGAAVGTRIASAFTSFPAGTSVSAVLTRTLGGTTVRRVTFTQNSNTTINAAGTVTFQFGDAQYALPGEQVFSFISNPGSTNSLSLGELKELTTTAIGGRGAFPNGPDVLAVNIYKVSGTAIPTSLILRWGEAQA